MPAIKFEIACIIQLGIIDPPDNFSLIYPIDKAIRLVNKIIKIVFKLPTRGKNITPCKRPNRRDCIKFALINPSLLASLFKIKPLNKTSSGKDVLKTAYIKIAGRAANLSPWNSVVAFSIFFKLLRRIKLINK